MASLSETQKVSQLLRKLSITEYCCRQHFVPPIAICRPVRADDLSATSEVQTELAAVPATKTSPDASHQSHSILGVPVEIFAEICTYLEPLDLRSLSLTNQAFRGILMSRDSKQIWKSSRIATYGDMPDCPDEMSEPQYVRFLFDLYCFTCKELAKEIDMINRVKSCGSCYEKNHLDMTGAMQAYPGFHLRWVFPMTTTQSDTTRYFYRPRMQADFDIFQSILKATPDECAAFEATQNQQTERAFEFAGTMSEWMFDECKRQQGVRYFVYGRRKATIRMKLVELGHAPIDIRILREETHFMHDVTEEEWVAMRPALEERTFKRKATRILEEQDEDEDDEADEDEDNV